MEKAATITLRVNLSAKGQLERAFARHHPLSFGLIVEIPFTARLTNASIAAFSKTVNPHL